MPLKIRELIHDLQAAGFVDRGGKGDPPQLCSGKPGDDAQHYQEKAVRAAIEEAIR